MKLLFVCTGNTCRSPMAAALFCQLAATAGAAITAESAGLAADGSAASAGAVRAMAERGIDLSLHRSRPVTHELCEQADGIITMSSRHLAALASDFGVSPVKLRLLGRGIPDPFGGDLAVYRAARDAIAVADEALLAVLCGPVTVDPMTEKDIASLAALEDFCFAQPWTEAGLREELFQPCAVFCVAHAADGTVAGYAGMHHVADEGAIANVAVSPLFRRRGVAGQLLQALVAYGRTHGLVRLTLEVRASNTAAIALYEGAGFRKDGIRPQFYTRPQEDAVLYSLWLDGKEQIL